MSTAHRSCAGIAACAAWLLAPEGFLGQTTGPSAQGAADEARSHAAWESEYLLAGRMRLRDTPLGQGDGEYPVGPGKLVLCFEASPARGPAVARLRELSLLEHIVVRSRWLFWTTTLEVDARSDVASDPTGFAAEGSFLDATLRWGRPAPACHTEGTMRCHGFGCGKLGVPRAGESALSLGPGPLDLRPFVFSDDRTTFVMPQTFAIHSDDPKLTADIALSGREVRHTAVDRCR